MATESPMSLMMISTKMATMTSLTIQTATAYQIIMTPTTITMVYQTMRKMLMEMALLILWTLMGTMTESLTTKRTVMEMEFQIPLIQVSFSQSGDCKVFYNGLLWPNQQSNDPWNLAVDGNPL